MSRTLSSAARQAMFAQQTGEVLVTLIEINYGPGLYIRICDDTQQITFNTNVYTPFPFQLQWPEDMDGGTVPTASLKIDMVDLSIYTAIVGTVTPPVFNCTGVLASDPTTQIVPTTSFTLGTIEGNDDTLTAALTLNIPIDEPFPGDNFTPANFPKLFTTVTA